MACPDKEKDKRIVAEVKRRQITRAAAQPEEIDETGHLIEFLTLYEESRIDRIENTGSQKWRIVLKPR